MFVLFIIVIILLNINCSILTLKKNPKSKASLHSQGFLDFFKANNNGKYNQAPPPPPPVSESAVC